MQGFLEDVVGCDRRGIDKILLCSCLEEGERSEVVKDQIKTRVQIYGYFYFSSKNAILKVQPQNPYWSPYFRYRKNLKIAGAKLRPLKRGPCLFPYTEDTCGKEPNRGRGFLCRLMCIKAVCFQPCKVHCYFLWW